MSEGQQFLAGIGQGVYNVGRHAANLVGLVSDADLAKAREQDAPLLSQGAGRGGSLLGQALTIAPAAMGGEALAGGLGLSAAAHPILAGIAEGAQMPTAPYPHAPHLMPGRPVTALDHHADRVARDAVASWHSFASYPPGHPSME
jgi:hypothetical protein